MVTVQEIPEECIEIMNRAAGRIHSRDGQVLKALAEVLTKWEELKHDQVQ